MYDMECVILHNMIQCDLLSFDFTDISKYRDCDLHFLSRFYILIALHCRADSM